MRKLEKGIRENLSSIAGRYRVHIGSFTGVDAMQPERVRQRLVRQLGPAFVHSRKLTRVHSAEKAAGELHGEVYDSGDSIELGLYIIDKEGKEEVAATNFEISKKLLRDIFPVGGGIAGSVVKNDEALPLPPPPPPIEVTALLERCAAHEKAHRLTRPPGANAADCHAQVLERDPGNAPAQAGLDSDSRSATSRECRGRASPGRASPRREAPWSGSGQTESQAIRGWRSSERG